MNERERKKLLAEALLPAVFDNWAAIRNAAARSLKHKASAFLPPDPSMQTALGSGWWGVVWQTGDKRFVVKASMDATEGPYVSLAMKHFRTDPGLAYYHRLWKLPERIWTDDFGYTNVWITVREEVDFSKQWAKTSTKRKPKPAKGYVKVFNALNELPECCQCLFWTRFGSRRGECPATEVKQAQRDMIELMDGLKGTPATYVAALVKKAWCEQGIMLGDIHYDNVGSRVHNMKPFGVKSHKKLVITDLGDWGQTVITSDQHPTIATLPGA